MTRSLVHKIRIYIFINDLCLLNKSLFSDSKPMISSHFEQIHKMCFKHRRFDAKGSILTRTFPHTFNIHLMGNPVLEHRYGDLEILGCAVFNNGF